MVYSVESQKGKEVNGMQRKRFMLRRVAHCSCCSEGGCCIQS